nr:hypothetical protein K-LCC10_0300 [Kaumoebavirus]
METLFNNFTKAAAALEHLDTTGAFSRSGVWFMPNPIPRDLVPLYSHLCRCIAAKYKIMENDYEEIRKQLMEFQGHLDALLVYIKHNYMKKHEMQLNEMLVHYHQTDIALDALKKQIPELYDDVSISHRYFELHLRDLMHSLFC